MLSMVWIRDEQEPELTPFQIQMSAHSSHGQPQHPLLSASSLGPLLPRSSYDAAGSRSPQPHGHQV